MIDLSRAKVNKPVPKNRFKAELSSVAQVRWLYKISADTADFRRGGEITEIQVFAVAFKSSEVNKSDLAAIQKAIPYPILFICNVISKTEDRGYNDIEKNRTSYIVIDGEVFESDKELLNGDTLTVERRSAKLEDLYEDITKEFLPIERKTDESIADFVVRYKRITAIEREIATLQRKVDNEKQTNKRFEYNEELKRLREEREDLI